MSLKTLKTIQPKEYELDAVQGNIKEFTKQLETNPVLDGIILKDVSLVSSGSNTINHKLGRKINGWIITKIQANANVWQNTTQPLPTKNLILETSADATVDIYVF
jgi:hypothetical protein